MPLASCHHVAVPPPHKCPLLGLEGRRGEAHPLVPPGRRGVVVRNLHHHRPGAAGECGLLLRLHRRLRPRLRGCDLLLWCRGRCLRLRLYDRGRRVCDNPPRKIPYYRLRPIHFWSLSNSKVSSCR
jgi:hypothetical protein